MALEDRDIFRAICERFADQPIEFIMAQYEKARMMNMEIERRSMPPSPMETGPATEETASVVEVVEERAPRKKRYTRRSFKVQPEDAITDDAIYCCICGVERQSLTSKHLGTHDLTVEEYKKLCNYPQGTALMSGKHLEKSKAIIAGAQQARLSKKAEKPEN